MSAGGSTRYFGADFAERDRRSRAEQKVRVSHVTQIAKPCHQVLFVLGAARALGRPLEILEPGGFVVGFRCRHLRAERPKAREVLRGDRDILLGDAFGKVVVGLGNVALLGILFDGFGHDEVPEGLPDVGFL